MSKINASNSGCSHPASFRVKNNLRMCASCGKTFEKNDELDSTAVLTGGLQLQLSAAEAERVEQSKLKTLHSQRKLGLILDIDHTILHATQVPTIPSSEIMQKYELDSIAVCVDGVHMQSHLIKLRPHLRQFLKRVSALFELSINTAGTRNYAEKVVQLIDPDSTLFRRRIVSRSDGVDQQATAGLEKSLARTYVGDSSDLAVILDDREDVWKGQQSQQLLLVKPFLYFQGAREVNNSSGQAPTFVESAVICLSESPPGSVRLIQTGVAAGFESFGFSVDMATHHDDSLLRMAAVLDEIHSTYYSKFDSTTTDPQSLTDLKVSSILCRMKSRVLENCVITFSGIIPKNDLVPAEYTPFWRLAKSLGARVTHDLTPDTTHLVTDCHQVKRATSKITACIRRDNVFVVHTDWLVYSRFALSKVSERTFSLITGVPSNLFPDSELTRYADVPTSSSSENERKRKRVSFHVEETVSGAAPDLPIISASVESDSEIDILVGEVGTDEGPDTVEAIITDSIVDEDRPGNDDNDDDADEDDDCFGEDFDEALVTKTAVL